MTGNWWIIIGVIALAISAVAIPYGFYMKSNEKSQPVIRQDTRGEQSPNIITGTAIEKGSITQKSSGTQSPNVVSDGEGTSLQIIYDTPLKKDQNALKDKKNDK